MGREAGGGGGGGAIPPVSNTRLPTLAALAASKALLDDLTEEQLEILRPIYRMRRQFWLQRFQAVENAFTEEELLLPAEEDEAPPSIDDDDDDDDEEYAYYVWARGQRN
jgi:hypothetical protein